MENTGEGSVYDGHGRGIAGGDTGNGRLSPQNAAYEFPCGPSHDPDFADLCLCGDLLSTPIGMDYLDAEVHIL